MPIVTVHLPCTVIKLSPLVYELVATDT